MASGVAVLSALEDEQQGLVAALEAPVCTEHAGRQFWQGRLCGRSVVVALSRIGKVAAAATTAALIERFAARAIVFTCVAGGVGPGVQVGKLFLRRMRTSARRCTRHVRRRWRRAPMPGVP